MPDPCPVIHFEMPYHDAERMKAFYQQAFGWTHQQFGPEMGNYVLAETGPTEDGRPTQPGVINGGYFPLSDDNPATHPSVVIAGGADGGNCGIDVGDGGTVLADPMEIPGIGRYAPFRDTEGNLASMLQPDPMG